MKLRTGGLAVLALAVSLGPVAGYASAAAVVGQPAPAFTATDSTGKTQSLADYKGKFVVLEWNNDTCPFVGKQYGSGNMQGLQKAYTEKGVAWLTINSSAPGKEGNVDAAQANAILEKRSAAPTAYLLDPQGVVGRAYGAKTTPHMFVIDPQGQLVYAGGIDDKPSTDQADVKTAKNYVRAALDEAMAGKPVTVPVSQPYGCAVKY
jgi:peroxiredoxin